ncbi:MAG: TonB-dependent receptor, partial [Candidatus Aminicenantes bacterium]|nr:TonB-dependent receptor [Candidatus Aminicenantes bacterium]
LSVIGFGAQLEGPLGGGKGSWMFSGNRSYLDLISKVLDSDNPSDYYDVQGKIAYDLGPRDRLSILAVGGSSRTEYDPEGREKFDYVTAGLTWRHLWGQMGYSDTSLSYSFINGKESEFWDWEGALHEQYDYGNKWLTFRNVNRLSLSPSFRLIFGAEAQSIQFRNWDDYEDVERRLQGTSAGAFVTAVVYPFPNFSLSPGLRLDYFPFSERINLSPRFSFDWTLTRRLSVNGAFGIYIQQMPLFLIQQDPGNASLRDPRARHLVLGLKYLLTPDTRLTLEAYDKDYSDFPMAPRYPFYFVVDDVNGDSDRFWFFGPLIDAGKAYARGVELTVQKKLAKKLYGLVSFSYYRARYRDLMGARRNRLFDNRFILCLSGGYKFSRNWELSARWIWSGNKAFTPVNEELSIEHGVPWVEFKDIMAGHLNDYRNLSLRLDRRLQFSKSNLVVFAGAWNIFDHDNELYRFWDSLGNSYLSESMWGIIPYIGLEFEF